METGANLQTIMDELLEPAVGPISYAEMQRRDAAVAKGLRPKWNDESPRDYSIAVDASVDVDEAFRKAVTGRMDPSQETTEIVADVLRRLSSDGDANDHFRKTDDDEPEETDDELAERDEETLLRTESSDGTQLR